MTVSNLQRELRRKSNPEYARVSQRFFKTGPGEYGEGDVFLGVRMPEIRKIVKGYTDLEFKDIQKLLDSKIHTERLSGLLILVNRFKKNKDQRKDVFDFYIKNIKAVNNWDLVDLTSPEIAGGYLYDKPRDLLYTLSKSNDLWKKRISIISTFFFIKNNDFKDTFKISAILLNDSHDLIHKAVGWMLREVGNRDQKLEEEFLKKHYNKMPRTMLRYAIEKFDEKKRQLYLKGRIYT